MLWQISCQIIANGDHSTKSSLYVLFSNKMIIKNEDDVNLIEGDDKEKEESIDKFYKENILKF